MKQKVSQYWIERLADFLRSRTFFWGIIAFFVFEAMWMVFTAVFPMAFDEDFHLGVIHIYSQQWSPFLATQPEGADAFGALARDPSYLYHYLMSFPYRLLTALVPSETAIIIILRLLNVALFTYALVLFRKVMLRATSSALITNSSLAVFVLIPIVPQLAAHINYDNLLMVLMAWLCLLIMRVIDEFRAKKLRASTLLLLVNLGLLTSLVKYAFLPIVGAAVVFVVYWGVRQFKGLDFRRLLRGSLDMSKPALVGLVALTLLSFGLFFQRFGVNTLLYHTPVPDCGQVLSYENCKSYGPWIRNHDLALTKGPVDPNPLAYTDTWLRALWLRMFFAVSGASNDFANSPPLPLPYITAVVLVAAGFLSILWQFRKVFSGRPFLVFAALVLLIYCGTLWFEDYQQYLETGQPVAINGRYLLPVVFLGMAIAGRAIQLALARYRMAAAPLAVIVILLFLNGGGVMTFISRSQPTWYWPAPAAHELNSGARKVLSPLIVEGKPHY